MSNQLTPILQVGAVGNPLVSDGRLLPYLTIDCSTCPDVEHLIDVHGDMLTLGDVISTWGWRRFYKSSVYLKLEFTRPVATTLYLAFPVATKGYVVDWIMSVRGFYLQSSKYGQLASEGFGKPAIVVEVPSATTFPIWLDIYRRELVKRFKGDGLRGKAVEHAISEYKARQREIWFRRPWPLAGLTTQ